ncbi:MAG: Mut7-C RNAse domain-containing protein [Candidatus Heimdallarchaeaceae archaeon]
MKFYIDAMFGNLARFLRFLGYDSLYRSNNEDVEEILETSLKENRTVVSRSKVIINKAKKKGIQAIYINRKDIVETLACLMNELDLDFTLIPEKARCSLCNGKLEQVEKKVIREKLEEGTVKQHDKFWKCKNCGQIYWIGSHWEDIRKKIALVKARSEKNGD